MSSSANNEDLSYDVVVVGGGPGGLIAALTARHLGASVLLIEQNFDVGGRGVLSGGGAYLGGGTSLQRAEGIEDSPERLFQDWVRADSLLGRYNDREVVWAYANNSAATFEFMTEVGNVKWRPLGAADRLDTVKRRAFSLEWEEPAGQVVPGQFGSGIVRPLEKAARELGVHILLKHRMVSLHRDRDAQGAKGRVSKLAIVEVDDYFTPTGEVISVKARQGVILATGGHSGNVGFRRMFDPRLTEEYQYTGQNWAPKTADGEVAAMAVGASIWGFAGQTNESDGQLSKGLMGTRSNYHGLLWSVDSPHFFREKATGLKPSDYQNLVLVRESGVRFYDETAGVRDYDYFAAAMSWSGDPEKLNGGGPIWAIFDAEAVEREGWNVTPPNVDTDGFFFSADTIEELAGQIQMEYQWRPMPPGNLRATIERYNRCVDEGVDPDHQKPTPRFKIQRPPFYAAWHTPVVHDSYAGLRINGSAQVIDTEEAPIPGLFATGDCASGFTQHGLGRAFTFGYIAARAAVSTGQARTGSGPTSNKDGV
ncbi:FAD binding domain-containing protein [Arthrobacter sp. cf158]|uniref:FAD-dependent oxidoreductase n=1 Tax=Arthrobacter sp. cf158 TaxID=1761744 RepID=UPI0008989C9B|nr:FAD-dependent oxidoreductase [Arthrobacter sp. cf158]SDX50151.1 FAD binding domain-containing protein [Arthrobacter sp. cf158]